MRLRKEKKKKQKKKTLVQLFEKETQILKDWQRYTIGKYFIRYCLKSLRLKFSGAFCGILMHKEMWMQYVLSVNMPRKSSQKI